MSAKREQWKYFEGGKEGKVSLQEQPAYYKNKTRLRDNQIQIGEGRRGVPHSKGTVEGRSRGGGEAWRKTTDFASFDH